MLYHSVMPFKPVQSMLILTLILLYAVGCTSYADSQLYRGNYTLGHEVNTFCPEINSRCYWLNPDTSKQVRDQLKLIYLDKSPGLYKPVCVIITGEVDKDSKRTGFAIDTDGLITITRVHGDCDSGKTVTQGDLQHHRWVLLTRDNSSVNPEEWPLLPALAFGERLFVEGSDGCRKFSGFAKLTGGKVDFNEIEFTQNRCGAGHSHRELFSIGGAWRVEIKESQYLILENTGSILMFRLDDWR